MKNLSRPFLMHSTKMQAEMEEHNVKVSCLCGDVNMHL